MEFPYDASEYPHFPAVNVSLENITTGAGVISKGQIDTGAAITTIPKKFAKELGLKIKGQHKTEDFNGNKHILPKFFICICSDFFESRRFVYGTNDKVCLIGRDILNQFTILLKGKDEILKVLE